MGDATCAQTCEDLSRTQPPATALRFHNSKGLSMSALRQRIPFTFPTEGDASEESRILDEQGKVLNPHPGHNGS